VDLYPSEFLVVKINTTRFFALPPGAVRFFLHPRENGKEKRAFSKGMVSANRIPYYLFTVWRVFLSQAIPVC
jgi:hypothetical protein